MSIALAIAITPAERDFLIRLLQYPLEEGPLDYRKQAKTLIELLEAAMTEREAQFALFGMDPTETEARKNGR